MKKLSLITLLLILSQVANATMYLTDSKGKTYGPYVGDCKGRHGYDSHFKCTAAAPPQLKDPNNYGQAPGQAHNYKDSITDDRRNRAYEDSRRE